MFGKMTPWGAVTKLMFHICFPMSDCPYVPTNKFFGTMLKFIYLFS